MFNKFKTINIILLLHYSSFRFNFYLFINGGYFDYQIPVEAENTHRHLYFKLFK